MMKTKRDQQQERKKRKQNERKYNTQQGNKIIRKTKEIKPRHNVRESKKIQEGLKRITQDGCKIRKLR